MGTKRFVWRANGARLPSHFAPQPFEFAAEVRFQQGGSAMSLNRGPGLKILALCLAGLMSAAIGHAAVIQASSTSLSDVRSAVSSAASGDTVVVPAGSSAWAGVLTITKGIILQGAGVGNTVIRSSISNPADGLIRYEPASPSLDEPFQVTGFSFECDWLTCGIRIQNESRSVITKVRVNNNRFRKALTGIYIDAEMYGLIDNNVFYECVIAIRCFGNMANPWHAWADMPVEVGTSRQIFIEDNTFEDLPGQTNTGMVVEGGLGGRYVFRYNTIVNWADFDILDMHGNQDPVTPSFNPGGSRATMCAEVYGNTIIANKTNRFVYLRGGTSIVFNNTMTGSGFTKWIRLTDEDGPTRFNFVSAYPGYDIITNTYIWNNVNNGSPVPPELESPATNAAFIQEGRDYFAYAKPGYAPFTYPHPMRSASGVSSPIRLRIKE
jgi:hypothetical protein